MKIKAILTGATGMVGEGVLHECLNNSAVDSVLIINRRPSGISHSKVKEIVHQDFFNLTGIEEDLKGYDSCFFCLGVSSIGLKESEYLRLTYTLTMNFAETLSRLNNNMSFCYISGTGTDSTEKGRSMWARVKGKTENDLQKLPFRNVYHFRPGYMHPTPGLKRTLKAYRFFSWLYPILKFAFPNTVSTLKEVGVAMINAVRFGYSKRVIDVPDIKVLAKQEK